MVVRVAGGCILRPAPLRGSGVVPRYQRHVDVGAGAEEPVGRQVADLDDEAVGAGPQVTLRDERDRRGVVAGRRRRFEAVAEVLEQLAPAEHLAVEHEAPRSVVRFRQVGRVDPDDGLHHGAVAAAAGVAERDPGRQRLRAGGRLGAAVEEGERPLVVGPAGLGRLGAHRLPVEREAEGAEQVAAARAAAVDLPDQGVPVGRRGGEGQQGGESVGRRPQAEAAALAEEDEVELAAHRRAVRVVPDVEGAEQLARRAERAERLAVQQQRLEAGVAGVAEAFPGRFDRLVETLAELVLRRLGVGIADGPEALDEGVALVGVPQFAEDAALRVGEDRIDGVEEVGVAAVEGPVLSGCRRGEGEEAEESEGRRPAATAGGGHRVAPAGGRRLFCWVRGSSDPLPPQAASAGCAGLLTRRRRRRLRLAGRRPTVPPAANIGAVLRPAAFQTGLHRSAAPPGAGQKTRAPSGDEPFSAAGRKTRAPSGTLHG